jgi:hypothetical protein
LKQESLEIADVKVVQLAEKKLVGVRVVCPGDEYVNEIPNAGVGKCSGK